MLDLLIRDAEHPRALAFQWQAIARDLGVLSAAIGGRAEEGVGVAIPELSDAELVLLEGEGAAAHAARLALAAQLQSLGGAAAQLSDRLSMRHFSHTHLDAQALAS